MSLVEEEMEGLIALAKPLPRFLDQRRVAHVVLPTGDRASVPVRSAAFHEWASGAYYKAHSRGVSSSSAMKATMSVVEALAREENFTRRLEPRLNRDDTGALWLDLRDAEGRAVRITRDGWSVVREPPPLFRRLPHMLPLPAPVPGGSLESLRSYVNLTSDEDFMLLRVALVVMVFPDIPRPLLLLHGGAGAAKTSAGNSLRRMIDPSVATGLAFPPNEHELALALDQHAFPIFDNASKFSKRMADALCRAVTGGAFVKRRLRTDQDSVLLEFLRPVAVTAINPPTDAPDLVDRMLMMELARLSPRARRTLGDLTAAFKAEQPAMLGALLDAVAYVLREEGSVSRDNLFRLADFHRLGRAAAQAFGYTAEKFDEAYAAKTLVQSWSNADDDGVARLIVDLLNDGGQPTPGQFDGSMSSLLAALSLRCTGRERAALPKTAAALGRRVRELEPVFQRMDVTVIFSATNAAGRRVLLTRGPGAVVPVTASAVTADPPAITTETPTVAA